MASSTLLASSVVMALIAVTIGFAVVTGRPWKRYSLHALGTRARDRGGEATAWVAGFVLLALVAIGGTIAVLGGAGPGTLVVGAAAGLTLAAFAIGGTYAAGRSRGHPHSHAVGEALAVLGGLVVLAIAANLLTQFGA